MKYPVSWMISHFIIFNRNNFYQLELMVGFFMKMILHKQNYVLHAYCSTNCTNTFIYIQLQK